MKKLFFISTFLFIISGLANAGVINVTSPAAGSTWCINQPANPVLITWHETPHDHDKVKIRLFDHTLTNQILKITDNTPNDGSYNWVIPGNIPPGQYVIRVKTLDDQESGNSGVFTISDCSPPAGSINVTKPENADTFDPGGNCPINWSSQGTVGASVQIRLFNSAGTSLIQNIANNTGNDGSFNWNIPNPFQTGNYRIKVQNLNETVTGISEIFTISETPPEATGSMTITRPKQGDYLLAGKTFDIEWRADGFVPNKCVNLYLFKGIRHVMQIAQNKCINGFRWNIPSNLSGSDYKIRLISTDRQVSDDSDKFPILPSGADLVVTEKMTRVPKHPGVNEFFEFKARIDNNGTGIAPASVAELIVTGPEGFKTTKRISIKKLGGIPDRVYIKKKLKLANMGIYRFTLKLDVDNNVQETDESNNVKWILVDVNPRPDLKITNVNTPDYKKTIQQKCTMNVTITNIGSANSGYFELDADLDTCPLIAQGRKYRTHQGLKPGQSVTFQFTHRYACFKMVGVDFHVDKANQVKESNENNNKCSLPFHISGENIVGKKKPWSSNCSNN